MLRIIITALLFFSIWPAAAQVLSTPPTNKVALSGERVRLGFSYGVNPDCSSQGEVKSRLLEHPKNGVAEMVKEKGSQAIPRTIKNISAMKRNPMSKLTIISHGRTLRERTDL